jgi:hypothetical protein
MNLILETTTGLLVPPGAQLTLARGGLQAVLVQFLTNAVAALLPNGAPIALRLYAPGDLVNPIATLSAFTALPADLAYRGAIDTVAGGLANVQSGTFLAKLSYGSPNVDSAPFQIVYGIGSAAAGAVPQTVISSPTGPVNYVADLGFFGGRVTVDQIEGFLRVKSPCNLLGLQLNAQDAPTGAALLVDIVKGGVPQGSIATLSAGQKAEETIFGTPVALAIGDIVQFKPTQVGSTKPGTNLTVKAIIQLL